MRRAGICGSSPSPPIYNDLRVTDDELRLYRAALSKALNSVSRGESILVPETLNDEQTVFAVDPLDL